MTDQTMANVRHKLETLGIALLRIENITADKEMLRGVEDHIGDALDVQNDFKGRLKVIEPKEGGPANTGDFAGELGPHVDGTQDKPLPPGVLAFQYFEGATVGGTSTFIDMAHVLKEDIPSSELKDVLIGLARNDAALCRKTKAQKAGPPWVGEYSGALVKVVSGGHAISLRLRFDEEKDAVLSVKPELQASLDKLAQAIKPRRQDLRTQFHAHIGDIVIFDNWRVLHGRTGTWGIHKRAHARVWIKGLAPRFNKELIGIRGLSLDLLNAIDKANRGPG